MIHDWTDPKPTVNSGPKVAELFGQLADEIDQEVVLQDRSSRRPPAGNEGIWFYETDTQYLLYDTGSEWKQVKPDSYHEQLSKIVTTKDDYEIENDVTFNQTVDGDISGEAETAQDAEFAEEAQSTQRIRGNVHQSYMNQNESQTITRRYAYRDDTEMRKVKVDGGVISLPDYG